MEATRYTEVGYVGSDTNSMIKDLMEIAVSEERNKAKKNVEVIATQMTEKSVLFLIYFNF